MKNVIRAFDSDTDLDDLANGDLVAAQAYSSDVLQARQQNPDLEFSLPEQGALKWVDSLAIPADAGRSENAHRFISFYLQPEVSARVAEAIQADTGNAAALDLVSDGLRSDPVVFPDEETQRGWCSPRIWAKRSRSSTKTPWSECWRTEFANLYILGRNEHQRGSRGAKGARLADQGGRLLW